MSNPRVDLLLWARRIVAKKSAEAHQILEVAADATLDQAQDAFHKLARLAHPDLHRTSLSAEDLETVTSAYAQVANAYQQFRTSKMQTAKVAVLKPGTPDPRSKRGSAISLPGGGVIRGTGTTRPPISTTQTHATPTVSRTTTGSVTPAPTIPTPSVEAAAIIPEAAPPAAAHASGQMNSRALLYYRKAESALRQGDLRAGVLNLKMAIAADPQAPFLRSALAEVEAEMRKTP